MVVEAGHFNHESFYRFDPICTRGKERQYTLFHETSHQYLYGTTTYGYIIGLLDRLSIINPNDNILIKSAAEVLSVNAQKINEGVATFFELFMKAIDFPNELDSCIKNLKWSEDIRKKYYKAVEDLLPFIKQKDGLKLALDIADIALGVDFSKIPRNILRNSKELNRFIVDSDNVKQFRPDSRYSILAKGVLNNIKNQQLPSEICVDKIAEQLGIEYIQLNSDIQFKLMNWIREEFSIELDEKLCFYNTIPKQVLMSSGNLFINLYKLGHPTPLDKRFNIVTCGSVPEINREQGILLLHWQNEQFVMVFYDVKEGICYNYEAKYDEVVNICQRMNMPVILLLNTYQLLKDNNLLTNIENSVPVFFLYIDMPYQLSKGYIKKSCNKPDAFLFEHYEVPFLFVKDKRKKYCFIQTFALNKDLMAKDIRNKYFNLVSISDEYIRRNFSVNLNTEDLINIVHAIFLTKLNDREPVYEISIV